ncbi:12238_t:CDS:2, partial [Cetraspora pellucida]
MSQQNKKRKPKYQKISLQIKNQIIDNVNNKGLPIREVAANFQLAASTVQKNRIAPKSRGGNKRSILNEQLKEFLEAVIEEELWISISDLAQKLVDQFPNIQSQSHLTMGGQEWPIEPAFTKASDIVPDSHNTLKTIQQRKEYIQKIYNENINIYRDMVNIDETGFNLHFSKSRGHARCGRPAIHKVVSNRVKNISVIAAINENGILHYKSILGSVNSEIFATFIDKLLRIIPNRKFLVMDNICFHKSDIVKEIVEDTTYQILYLPPYSPFLNMIENCFSKIKDSVAKNYLKDQETILSRMNNAFNIVMNEDCEEWI